MNNILDKVQQWVDSPIHQGDKFYRKSTPDLQYHALGLNGGKMVCSTDKNKDARIWVDVDSDDNYKKPEDFQGANPFIETSINFIAFDLSNILNMIGFDRRDTNEWDSEIIEGVSVPRCNLNPFMIVNGEKQHYQRGNVWTLEQKQALIDTIYRGLEAGRIIVHKHGYRQQVKSIKEGTILSNFDIVDGKQRLTAITEFLQGKFADNYGNYFTDLSSTAKRAFGNYRGIIYGELPEESTNKQICNAFLNNSVSGVPLSIEHIEFVKQLKEKA